MTPLTQIDRDIFFFINQDIHTSFLDTILVPLRNQNFWIPVYVLLAAYFVWRFKKNCWIIFAFAGLTFLMTDQISSDFIKPWVHRVRPCHDPVMEAKVRTLVGCGSGFSFPSSHATNHFGLSLFLIMVLRKRIRWTTPVLIFWAAIISFAQVYVGLHYPSDVFGGMLIGGLIGFTTGKICERLLEKKMKPVSQ
ncbi:MAG: phosphatase PAP2 family protein [Chitinophagales bacterium]|nr:phosphatase PAP2 family protein [Chitinophagales bacterium]